MSKPKTTHTRFLVTWVILLSDLVHNTSNMWFYLKDIHVWISAKHISYMIWYFETQVYVIWYFGLCDLLLIASDSWLNLLKHINMWFNFSKHRICDSGLHHMGAGYNNLRRKKKKQQCKVGHEEEGSSSNRPELAAFLLARCDTLIFVISCWRKVKTGQSLSKMSKPTALHTEGTAQVSEWLNISDTAKKLY